MRSRWYLLAVGAVVVVGLSGWKMSHGNCRDKRVKAERNQGDGDRAAVARASNQASKIRTRSPVEKTAAAVTSARVPPELQLPASANDEPKPPLPEGVDDIDSLRAKDYEAWVSISKGLSMATDIDRNLTKCLVQHAKRTGAAKIEPGSWRLFLTVEASDGKAKIVNVVPESEDAWPVGFDDQLQKCYEGCFLDHELEAPHDFQYTYAYPMCISGNDATIEPGSPAPDRMETTYSVGDEGDGEEAAQH